MAFNRAFRHAHDVADFPVTHFLEMIERDDGFHLKREPVDRVRDSARHVPSLGFDIRLLHIILEGGQNRRIILIQGRFLLPKIIRRYYVFLLNRKSIFHVLALEVMLILFVLPQCVFP